MSCDQRINRLHLQFYQDILQNHKREQHLINSSTALEVLRMNLKLVQTPRDTTAYKRTQAQI